MTDQATRVPQSTVIVAIVVALTVCTLTVPGAASFTMIPLLLLIVGILLTVLLRNVIGFTHWVAAVWREKAWKDLRWRWARDTWLVLYILIAFFCAAMGDAFGGGWDFAASLMLFPVLLLIPIGFLSALALIFVRVTR